MEDELSDNIQNTQALAKSHGLEFTDHGGGHVQIKGHGILVNYWPDSKNRTAHILGGQAVKHCNPYDAVKLCMTSGQPTLAPKKATTEAGPDVDLRPVSTNPAGLKHFYDGARPPWEFPSMIQCQSDILRLEALKLRNTADLMDVEPR